MVRSFCGGCCCGFLGGWGTSASRPLGVTGTITMKIISKTRRISIMGVTLISPIAPPPPPVENAMVQTPRFLKIVQQTIWPTELLAADLIAFPSLRQQADFFNAGSAHIVDGVLDRFVLRALIRAN